MGNTQDKKPQPKPKAINRDDITHRMIDRPDVAKKQERGARNVKLRRPNIS
jgi:hypothetical protein